LPKTGSHLVEKFAERSKRGEEDLGDVSHPVQARFKIRVIQWSDGKVFRGRLEFISTRSENRQTPLRVWRTLNAWILILQFVTERYERVMSAMMDDSSLV
jgi:hypothetical protein